MPTRRPRTSHRSPCPGRASRDTRSMGLREPITAGKGGNPPPPGTHGVGRAQPRGQRGAAGGGAGGRRGEAVLCASFIQSMCLGGCHPVAGCCYRELPHRREALSCRAEKFKNLSRRGHSAITCRLHRTTSPPPSPRVLHETSGASLDPSPSTPHEARPCRELGGGGHAKPGTEASEQRRGLHSPRSRWRRQQHFPEWFLKTVVGVFPSYLLGFNKQRQVKASSFSWHI